MIVFSTNGTILAQGLVLHNQPTEMPALKKHSIASPEHRLMVPLAFVASEPRPKAGNPYKQSRKQFQATLRSLVRQAQV